MHTKIILFALVGMSLVLAVYSFSTYRVFAEGTSCEYYGKDKSKATCTNIDEDGDLTRWACEKLNDGNWTCVQIQTSTGTDIPPDLRDAISKAQAQGVQPDLSLGESGNNDTKVPKGSFLDDGGLLKGQGDNQSPSTSSNVGPGFYNRFCIEGTGGKTGNVCIPCDPGLPTASDASCIDTITGGPLDMPDAATSETEEGDDTNPKDLDGSNNAESGPEVNPGSD